ncbi:MAG: hypothetical protein PHD00_11600 [Bacteroidales bacterium]|jgi:hypothetical protein|nr:hypothetical protein [Bacteroidales bacterium]MDD4673661.1 hypothetical protein [Bacteroidales bacterium]MDY0348309.1 hypothetical protein [Tenuifilaceae bacterium]
MKNANQDKKHENDSKMESSQDEDSKMEQVMLSQLNESREINKALCKLLEKFSNKDETNK